MAVDGTPGDGPGQVLCIARDSGHPFDNPGGKDARQLAAKSSALMGPVCFREAAGVVGAIGGPSDSGRNVDVLRRYGITAAEPPRGG